MSDALARDPVFGEIARALRVRGGIPSTGFGPRRNARSDEHVTASFRAGALSAEQMSALKDHRTGVYFFPQRSDFFFTEKSGFCLITSLRDAFVTLPAKWNELTDIVPPLMVASQNFNRALSPLRMMGVVNVTPDSFSDGGQFLGPKHAIEHGLKLAADGAEMLDIGGESTRPGSAPVSADEELRRVIPVIAGLARETKVALSIDTTKSSVARAALDAGATIVNDVSAGRFDDAMFRLVAQRKAGCILMHMQGTPRSMQVDPRYDDVASDVLEFLRERCYIALRAGVDRSTLWIDPGIGFGKTLAHNFEILRRLPELRSLGLSIVLGVSRKSFIAAVDPRAKDDRERTGGTAAALTLGVLGGAEILRVHDVATMRQAALVARALSESAGLSY